MARDSPDHAAQPATAQSAARDLTGRTLHHYRVLEKLGQGGMGEVWMAEDLHLERKIALKLLPASDAVDSDRLLRFEREAKAVAALDHPNIVTLHSIETLESDPESGGTESDGGTMRFLTMELVAGERLDRIIPDGGMDLATFLGLSIPIADAVAAAHARGVTHRDLKPTNVVLTADGRPKVLDFGLAKLRDGDGDDTTKDGDEDGGEAAVLRTLTRTATHVAEVEGTLPYMSPEQLTGESTGRPSDVFSLGVMLHEMLTGSRPFQSSHMVGLMAAILRDQPPSLTEVRPDLPAELVAVVEKCLAKKQVDRYADAGELRDALQHVKDLWLSGSSTTIAAPPGRPRRLRRALTLLGLGLLAVALVAVGLDRWLNPPTDGTTGERAEPPARIAVMPFENLGNEDDRYFAQGVAEEIRSRLAAVGGLSVISRSAVARHAEDGLTPAEIAGALGVDYLLDGTVRWDRSGAVDRVRVTPQLVRVGDGMQLWSNTYDRELQDIFSVQSDIAEEVIGNLDIALFPAERRAVSAERPTSSLPAYQAFLRGRDYLSDSIYERAAYESAIRELETAVDLDPSFAAAHATLSETHSMMYHLGHDRTPERAEQSKRSLDAALALAPDAPEVRFARGYYRYRVDKDYEAALDDFRAVVDRLPSAADGFEAMAYVLRRQGRLEDAVGMLHRALELDPGSGRLTIEIATTYLFLREYSLAERFYDTALLQSPNDANVYRALAMTHWLSAGDLEAAREALSSMPPNHEAISLWYWFHQHLYEGAYQSALDIVSQPLSADEGESDGMILWTFFAYPSDLLRAQALDLLGRSTEAEAACAAAESLLRERLERSPQDSRLHSALGLALVGLGQTDEAVAAARRGTELLPVSLDAGTGPYRLFELALVQTQAGDLDGALTTLREVLSVPARVSKDLIEIDPRFADLVEHPGFGELP